jgi:hypothetical protein
MTDAKRSLLGLLVLFGLTWGAALTAACDPEPLAVAETPEPAGEFTTVTLSVAGMT